MRSEKNSGTRVRARALSTAGFSVVEVLITLALIAILVGFAVARVEKLRENMKLASEARVFAGYVEKVRLDAIRRHGGGAQPPSIQFLNNSAYNVTTDHAGNGTISTRTITFGNGITVASLPPQPLTFDWRGRMSQCSQTFTLLNSISSTPSTVDVSGAGDVTIDGDPGTIPAITPTPVAQTDVDTDGSVAGTSAPPSAGATGCAADGSDGSTTDNGTVTSSSTCTNLSATPLLQSIRKNGGGTATITVTSTKATTLTASAASFLSLSPTSQSISAGGTTTFRVVSTNTSRGTFPITIGAPCTSVTVQVRVTN